ncbi:Rv1733c family protein [Actinacidiphila sp. ITFR-21]|uniref:Rv1733c family protein n=1 Tax=Actinacidiphila sp. ITFR-21 TaxID=3075199 RepID=UPI00288A0AD7|nr:hypothetical protein [Streptomyces sp. ITFR-21]WNI19279.1 hypothetical protein RLT57_29520 [Streptomyces sp. ITFR-21]
MGPSASPSARRRKRLKKTGWQWRRNSLRRRTDMAEAWLGVLTGLLFCLVPVFGWWSGQSVDRTLQRVVRVQRAERFLVTATAVSPGRSGRSDKAAGRAVGGAARQPSAGAPAMALAAADVTAQERESNVRGDLLKWTAPDHSVHVTTVSVDLEVWDQGRILLWTDRAGHLVPPPLDSATATTHSVLAGTAAAASAGGLLLITRQVVMWRLMRRRLDGWEREWARVGQDWGRAGAGG